MASSQGFATVSVAGDTFTYSIYKVGTDAPVWSKTFTKGTHTITGNAGLADATLSYVDGTEKTVTADGTGAYSFAVPDNWTGTVTANKAGYGFSPRSRDYTFVTTDLAAQDFSATAATTYYVDNTNTTKVCSDDPSGPQGTIDRPFCTITRGALKATVPGDTVHVLAGTYAETVFLEHSGTAGNPITFLANPGVTVTGRTTDNQTSSGFSMGEKSYIVIDGFTITNTRYKGIYVDASDHITISNNHVSYAGATSTTPPLRAGHLFTEHDRLDHHRQYHRSQHLYRHPGDHRRVQPDQQQRLLLELLAYRDGCGRDRADRQQPQHGDQQHHLLQRGQRDQCVFVRCDRLPLPDVPSTYNLVINNLSYENGDHGIDNNNSPYNTLIGNTVQGNGTVGINFEGEIGTGSHHATALNNISVGNGFTPPGGSSPSFGGNLRVDTALGRGDGPGLQPVRPPERGGADHLGQRRLPHPGGVPGGRAHPGGAWAGRGSAAL